MVELSAITLHYWEISVPYWEIALRYGAANLEKISMKVTRVTVTNDKSILSFVTCHFSV